MGPVPGKLWTLLTHPVGVPFPRGADGGCEDLVKLFVNGQVVLPKVCDGMVAPGRPRPGPGRGPCP